MIEPHDWDGIILSCLISVAVFPMKKSRFKARTTFRELLTKRSQNTPNPEPYLISSNLTPKKFLAFFTGSVLPQEVFSGIDVSPSPRWKAKSKKHWGWFIIKLYSTFFVLCQISEMLFSIFFSRFSSAIWRRRDEQKKCTLCLHTDDNCYTTSILMTVRKKARSQKMAAFWLRAGGKVVWEVGCGHNSQSLNPRRWWNLKTVLLEVHACYIKDHHSTTGILGLLQCLGP